MNQTAIVKLHRPSKKSHKGQNGKLLVIGGSDQYHGAPKFSVLAARRFVDLIYFFPGQREPNLIREIKKIPEVIVLGDDRALAKQLADVDCVLFGIGLADAIPVGSKKLNAVLKTRNARLVIDGDGLRRVKGRIPVGSILTPHEGEFRMLFGIEGSAKNVRAMAREHGCVILKKGLIDHISDGKRLVENRVHNQGMTKGGTGDVLSGLVAALACKNDPFTAAVAGAQICGRAGNLLFKKYGYNFSSSDLAEMLAEAARNPR